jgi:hypothetical protein
MTGYIWDAKEDPNGGEATPVPQGFLELRGDAGLLDFVSASLQSCALTFLYGTHPQLGNIKAALKLTTPNNKDLRFVGPGVEIAYAHSFLQEFISPGGYRFGGTGFSSIGPIVEGGTVQVTALCDFDMLSVISLLPLKLMFNVGYRMPIEEDRQEFSEYLAHAGVAYVGLNFDVFVEYSLQALVSPGFGPKQFSHTTDWGWDDRGRTWEVAFAENPMYVTIGGRYRHEKGFVIYGCVPLLLSTNRGSTLEHKRLNIETDFPDEWARGVNAGFDPWYARWKLVLQLSYPFRFRQTGSEMRRNFVLLKHREQRKKMDIDERIESLEHKEVEPKEKEDEQEMGEEKRLKAIRKRRREVQESK